MCRPVALSTGLRVCVSDHAKQRLAEMRIDPRAVAACLTAPDETWESGKYAGLNKSNVGRGDLTLAIGPCDDHVCIITALPRTQEKWLELDSQGLLPPDRSLRSMKHLPTRAEVRSRGRAS